MQTMWI